MRHLRPFPLFPLAVTLLLLIAPAASFSEPPPGYYASVDVKTQTALRSTLHEIIDDHIRFPYTSSNTDTWDILELADEDPNNPSNILDVYKNASYLKAGGGNTNYEREHTWPNVTAQMNPEKFGHFGRP